MPRVTSSIRFSDHEKELFRLAADRQRMTLSEWVRATLRGAVEQENAKAARLEQLDREFSELLGDRREI